MQQCQLAIKSSAESDEFSGASNDSMTRNDNRDRISSVRQSHSPGSRRISHRPGDFPVAGRLAVGDRAERPPDLFLEVRSFRCQWYIEFPEAAIKIRPELPDGILKLFFAEFPARLNILCTKLGLAEGNVFQPIVIACHQQTAHRGVVHESVKHRVSSESDHWKGEAVSIQFPFLVEKATVLFFRTTLASTERPMSQESSLPETRQSASERLAQVAALRWEKFPVLDDGFVCLVDVMGDDGSVVQAARVSYGEGTKKVSDDRTLIRYLLRHRHTTPFEMAEIKFLVRVPMDCWRQWVRHRTANINEYSTRYSFAIDSAQTTPEGQWRSQAESNRQGSGDALPHELGMRLSGEEKELQDKIRSVYQSRIESGVAREQARKDLPLSTYTEAYWKIDLHNLLHFLALRMDSHAQLEIRNYATTIGEKIVAPLFPLVWEAFLDYRMQAMFLTRLDREVIQRLTANAAAAKKAPPWSNDDFLAAQDPSWVALTRSRERDECRSKLELLGMVVPLQSGPECAADPSRA